MTRQCGQERSLLPDKDAIKEIYLLEIFFKTNAFYTSLWRFYKLVAFSWRDWRSLSTEALIWNYVRDWSIRWYTSIFNPFFIRFWIVSLFVQLRLSIFVNLVFSNHGPLGKAFYFSAFSLLTGFYPLPAFNKMHEYSNEPLHSCGIVTRCTFYLLPVLHESIVSENRKYGKLISFKYGIVSLSNQV